VGDFATSEITRPLDHCSAALWTFGRPHTTLQQWIYSFGIGAFKAVLNIMSIPLRDAPLSTLKVMDLSGTSGPGGQSSCSLKQTMMH